MRVSRNSGSIFAGSHQGFQYIGIYIGSPSLSEIPSSDAGTRSGFKVQYVGPRA